MDALDDRFSPFQVGAYITDAIVEREQPEKTFAWGLDVAVNVLHVVGNMVVFTQYQTHHMGISFELTQNFLIR